ncbi:type I 3-dehydroquinate dehydratase [uncultured Fibrobacter sp.]|uniref:type I 3-dehydroquinate dehydratase n=1 Tax=uncultured Fibrobacter sp. TaxID=261512 RepID=UPI001B03B45A|nr:type I 3-dehydroquinate dehydratase [uncultured Fibrobacter sp.]MBO7105504.1 type I 3-dehydroquinate dehydratase [Fibrobacter sp.]
MQREDVSKAPRRNLVGLVSPHILSAAEAEPVSPMTLDLQACDMLEIRYDWFEKTLWPGLSARVRKIAPDSKQIGTIRLARDGGSFPDDSVVERLPLWQSILTATEVPEWLDLERDCLHDYNALAELAAPRGTRIIVSEHNFARIPTALELKKFAQDVQRVKAAGLKIAAMSNGPLDCQRLYQFASKNAKNFDLFAAFGMGKTGKPSRIWSLHEGANLTYGSIEVSAAPGQIDVLTMRKALDTFDSFLSESDVSAFLNKFE